MLTGAYAAARALFDRRRRRRIVLVTVLAALMLTPGRLVLASPPGEVAARIADRRLTVSWNAVAGADGYVVAVRPANGIVPFAWEEYDAASSPWTIADLWAMSGVSYEVRVAAVTDGKPAWSPAVTVTAPVLRQAPAGTIGIRAPAPPAVGDHVMSALNTTNGQRPSVRFTNRSIRWSVCGANGTDCRLLPSFRRARDYFYVIGNEMRGKFLRLQVDYDRDGVSWSATADMHIATDAPRRPVVPRSYLPPPSVAEASRACPRRPRRLLDVDTDGAPADATTIETIETHLHALTVESVRLGTTNDMGHGGGSIDALCDDLLVVTAWGRFVLLSGGRGEILAGRVPMASDESGVVRIPELETRYPDFNPRLFRVADILLRPRSTNRWRLFVTHNYADGECFGFRLSATAVRREGGRVVVSPAWRTVSDLAPCAFTAAGSIQAGGRMLSDGPNHLLVATGAFADRSQAQDPDSNSGKLLRVDVETGRTEVLAVGFRNPQGLARDADGVLWETEHGPRGGDELNVLEAGANYGWPLVTHGVVGMQIRDVTGRFGEGRHDGYASPRFFWAPSIAVSSVIVNDARFFPLWDNDLLVGTLGKTSAVFRVRRDGTDVKSAERIDVGRAIRDMASMPDGRIALFDGSDHVLFVSRSEKYCNEEFRPGHIWSLHCPPVDAGASPRAGR